MDVSRSVLARLARHALLTVAFLLVVAPPAAAAGSPDITLDKQAPARQLFGTEATVRLVAGNPAGQPYGYNLSFRDVLPAGVSYVAGSSTLAPRIVANQPAAGQTTLIWENVSDLSPNSSYALTYRVAHSTTTFDVGDPYTNAAGAYIQTNPALLPRFGANGTPTGGTSTGSATDTATTLLTAVAIDKEEPSPEGELLRGVHDHRTVYTLRLRNNAVHPTSAIVVEDYLPAGLEYLACGVGDNTTNAPTNPGNAPESPGAPALNAGGAPGGLGADCVAPTLAETVSTDPDGPGPLPSAVYTHVRWSGLADLATGETRALRYVAAIPIRENTTTWSGGAPATNGPQASNLDNNSGAETADEQALTNYATVSGLYDGTILVMDDGALTRVAEDLRILKSVDQAAILQGGISEWTLTIASSEYRTVANLRVTDTVPDGLCPLGTVNHDVGAAPECAPTGDVPIPAYSSVAENADGSYTLAWNALPSLGTSDTEVITFPTRTRTAYQATGQPVRARDTWTNTVSVLGEDTAPAAIDHDEPDGLDDPDGSSASQQAEAITVDKKVRQVGGTVPVDCSTGTYIDTVAATYRPGDRICWKIRVDFPGLVDTGSPTVTDFLPPNMSYEAGSQVQTAASTVPATFSGSATGPLTWDLGANVDQGSQVFEAHFSTIVTGPLNTASADILANLLKVSFANTAGTTFALRDQAEAEVAEAQLTLDKRVRLLPGGALAPAITVDGGAQVRYQVDLANLGGIEAEQIEVWDVLPAGIECGPAISNITDGGTCVDAAQDRIVWTNLAVAAAAGEALTYDVTIPTTFARGKVFTNHAGVRSYASDTNLGGSFGYVPANNIDPGAGTPNTAAADDTAAVSLTAVTIAKTRTTSVNETGNAAGAATIGETIDYQVDVTLPANQTFHGTVALTDTLPAGQTVIPASVGRTPAIGTLGTVGNTISVTLPDGYTPGASAVLLRLTFSATVDDIPATTAGDTLANAATFGWTDAATGGTARSVSSSVSTAVVEPGLSMAKDENDANDRVDPGQAILYSVTAANAAGASRAHDLVIEDIVPAGLTPDLPSISDGGTWNPGTRTITWSAASLAPGASAARTYTATVDEPAVAGSSFTNVVDVTASSLAGTVTGERTTYTDDAQDTVFLQAASVTKTVDRAQATVGSILEYTVDLTLQPDIQFYDVAVLDALPDGVDFDSTVATSCSGTGCAGLTATELAPSVQADGSTRLAWAVGDVAPSASARTITVVFRAHVDDAYVPSGPVVSGDALVNSARGGYDRTPGGDAPGTDPAGYDETTVPATATTTVREPSITVDKDVSGQAGDSDVRRTQPGDAYTYTLTVTNTGNWPAYDVTVTDQPDDDLVNVVPVSGAALVTDNWSAADRDLSWDIPGPIAAGASVTLTYTADLGPSSGLADEEAIPNIADVSHFFGVPLADRNAEPSWDFRDYTAVPADTVTLTADLPALSVVKTADTPANAEIGQPFPWRVVVTNTATTATAANLAVTDLLPPEWDFTAVTGATPAPTTTTAGPAWANLGNLAPGASRTLTFTATPREAAAANADPQVNTASASAGDLGGGGPYTALGTAGATVVAPTLAIVKTPDAAPRAAGAPTSWTVTVSNTGDGQARNVVVTDTLPTGATYAPNTATAVPATGFAESSVSGATITWTVASVPAGGQVAITVPVTLDASLAAGATLTNTASARADERPAPISDTGSFTVVTQADVSVDKEAPASVEAGDILEYTLTVANAGPSDAQDVTLSDVLPGDVTFVSVEAPCTQSAGTVSCALGTLSPGASRELTLRVRVKPGEVGDVANTATVDTTTADTDTGNDTDTETTPLGVLSDLRLVKSGPATVLRGQNAAFTLLVTNAGPSDATNVAVSDPLPPGATFVVAGSDPRCAESAGVVTCTLGTLGESASTTLAVVLRLDAGGPTVNQATVASPDAVDPSPANNVDDHTVTVLPAADLAVTKTGDATVEAGGTATYTLTVRNDGPDVATGVVLRDTLPAGTTFAGSLPGDACTAADAVVTCPIGTLAAGAEVVVQVRVGVPIGLGTTTLTNTVVVDGDQGDPDGSDDTATATTLVGPAVDLKVSKTTAGAVAGGEITWTISVVNGGPATATAVTLADPLPAGTTYVSALPGQGTCALDGSTVRCELGALEPQGATQVAIVAQVADDQGGRLLANTATATTPEPEITPEDNSGTVSTPIGTKPPATVALAVSKVAATQRPQLGEPLDYTIRVRNPSTIAATNVMVTDALAASLDLVSARPTQGTCIGARAVVCELGTLPPGGEATVTVRVIPQRSGRIDNLATADSAQSESGLFTPQDVAGIGVRLPLTSLRLAKRADRGIVRAGRTVTFALTLRMGRNAGEGVELCDLLPTGMTVVKAPAARLRGGRPCWRWAFLPARAVRRVHVTVRVAPGASVGALVNEALASARNASRRRDDARIRVIPGAARGGGVTG